MIKVMSLFLLTMIMFTGMGLQQCVAADSTDRLPEIKVSLVKVDLRTFLAL